MIVKIFKTFLFLMSLAGLYVFYTGIGPVVGTIQFLMQKPQEVKGIFEGYDIITTFSRSSNTSGRRQTASHDYYPKFSYKDKDGKTHHIKSYHKHLYEIYSKGDQVEILIPEDKDNFNQPRIAGFLSLFSADGLYVVVGLFMTMVGLLFFFKFPWGGSLTADGRELNIDSFFNQFWDRVNSYVNLRWIPGMVKNIALLGLAILIAYILVIWKPWQIPARETFLTAAEKGNIAQVKSYIDDGYNLDIVNDYDQTALNLAAENQHWAVARLLLNAGAQTDIESKMHRYPIDWAVYYNDTQTTLLILEKGSPVNNLLTDPLSRAYLNHNFIILEALMKAGADLQKTYPEAKNMTFGDIMILKKDEAAIQLVKKYGGRFTR